MQGIPRQPAGERPGGCAGCGGLALSCPSSTLRDGVRAPPGCRRQRTWSGHASEGSEGNQLCGSKSSPPGPGRCLQTSARAALRKESKASAATAGVLAAARRGRACLWGRPGPQLAALSAGGATCWCLPKGLKVGVAGNQAAGPSAPQRPPAQETAVWRDSRFRRSPGAAPEDTKL